MDGESFTKMLKTGFFLEREKKQLKKESVLNHDFGSGCDVWEVCDTQIKMSAKQVRCRAWSSEEKFGLPYKLGSFQHVDVV